MLESKATAAVGATHPIVLQAHLGARNRVAVGALHDTLDWALVVTQCERDVTELVLLASAQLERLPGAALAAPDRIRLQLDSRPCGGGRSGARDQNLSSPNLSGNDP